MREIKLRAWDEIDEEWKYSGYPNMPMWQFWENVELGDYKNVCEFTGLHDKNGKEIYEGDILKYDGEERVVVYEAPSFELQLKDSRAFAWDNWSEFGEIIGNIYENPELLTT